MANRFKEIKMISSLEQSFNVTQKLFTQNGVDK